MALPGHRRTSSHKRRRAAHFALKKTNLTTCPKCGQPVAPHQVCGACGFYKGREVLNMSRQDARVLKRSQAQAAAKTSAEEPKHEKKSDNGTEEKKAAK